MGAGAFLERRGGKLSGRSKHRQENLGWLPVVASPGTLERMKEAAAPGRESLGENVSDSGLVGAWIVCVWHENSGLIYLMIPWFAFFFFLLSTVFLGLFSRHPRSKASVISRSCFLGLLAYTAYLRLDFQHYLSLDDEIYSDLSLFPSCISWINWRHVLGCCLAEIAILFSSSAGGGSLAWLWEGLP